MGMGWSSKPRRLKVVSSVAFPGLSEHVAEHRRHRYGNHVPVQRRRACFPLLHERDVGKVGEKQVVCNDKLLMKCSMWTIVAYMYYGLRAIPWLCTYVCTGTKQLLAFSQKAVFKYV